jgi:hypothetical protein
VVIRAASSGQAEWEIELNRAAQARSTPTFIQSRPSSDLTGAIGPWNTPVRNISRDIAATAVVLFFRLPAVGSSAMQAPAPTSWIMFTIFGPRDCTRNAAGIWLVM